MHSHALKPAAASKVGERTGRGPAAARTRDQGGRSPQKLLVRHLGNAGVQLLARTGGPVIQRACGRAVAAARPCTPLGGDITDVGATSADLFRFDVNCDDLRPGEEARLAARVRDTLGPGAAVTIHGFASEEGDPAFNDRLSCARAVKAEDVAQGALTASPPLRVTRINHGATPGGRDDRRSVVLEVPLPTPAPPTNVCAAGTNPDRFDRRFHPTTASEIGNAASHPIDAFTANSLADDALARARGSGLAGLHLGPADAFRHCFWNCRMAQELGAAAAERFATAHENSGPSPIPHDDDMDLHNNFVGRSLGVPGANCETECRNAVTTGQLRTVRQPPDVATGCLGASDQRWP